jgi:nucleoside-diphosphate-sugar epimerase
MAKALITGIDGFTGRYLASALQQAGYDVVGNASRPSHSPWPTANLLDRNALASVIAQHGPTLAAQDYCPESVLVASGANDYAISKLASEHVARLRQPHLPISTVRPFNYTGVGQQLGLLLPKIVDHFRRRAATIESGNLNVVRDFSHVRDVVTTNVRLLASAVSGNLYNVCSAVGHSLLDVIHTIGDLSGHRLEIKVNPAFARSNEVSRLVGSDERMVREFGAQPRIPPKEILPCMLASEA